MPPSLTLFLLVHLHILAGIAKIRHEASNQSGEAFSGQNTRDRRQGQHETNHNSREVPRDRAVENQEDVAVADLLEEEVDTDGSQRHHDLEIEEEGGPCGGLMLGDRCDNGNVFRGVSGIQKREGATRPASDARNEQKAMRKPEDLDQNEENHDGHDEREDRVEEIAIVLLGELIVGEHQQRVA